MALTRDETTELELLIDRHGLAHILGAISLICSEKAEHICENWQDRATAKPWTRVARGLDQMAGGCVRAGLTAP